MKINEKLDAVLTLIYSGSIFKYTVQFTMLDISNLFFYTETVSETLNGVTDHVLLKKELIKKRNDVCPEIENRKELVEVIEKLAKDGYLYKEIDMYDIAIYYTALEGRFFIESGGYTEKARKEKNKATNQVLRNWLLAIAAIVGSLYSAARLSKEFGCSFVSFWTGCFLGLTCTLIVLVLWLVVQEIERNRSRE